MIIAYALMDIYIHNLAASDLETTGKSEEISRNYIILSLT